MDTFNIPAEADFVVDKEYAEQTILVEEAPDEVIYRGSDEKTIYRVKDN